MFRNLSIRARLIYFILASCFLIFGIIFIFNYYITTEIVIKAVENNAKQTGETIVFEIEGYLKSVETNAKNLATFIETTNFDQQGLENILKSNIESSKEIFGVAAAYEPYKFDKNKKLYSAYFYGNSGNSQSTISFKSLNTDKYNYLDWSWYKYPQATKKSSWSEPYLDDGGGNIVLTSFSTPIYRKGENGREFVGVIANDLSLDWLTELILSYNVYNTGYTFLVSTSGMILVHPNKNLVMKESFFSLAKKMNDTALASIGYAMKDGKSGFVPYTSKVSGIEGFMYYRSLPSNGWSFGIVFPKKELLADVTRMANIGIVLILIGLFLISILVYSISSRITKPIQQVSKSAEAIANGEISLAEHIAKDYAEKYLRLDIEKKQDSYNKNKLKIINKNEIVVLFKSILGMTDNLNSLISKVQQSGIQVITSATEISASARQLEATATEQVASTQAVTTQSKKIATTSEALLDTIFKVGNTVDESVVLAENGKKDIEKMSKAMQELTKASNSISSKLSIINDNANRISIVVTTINKISEQTNLLSLNAAIEAEKAGDYGKGFSVVAREISRLSDQTSVATEDIAHIVKEMTESVSSGVMEMDKFSQEVKNGTNEISGLSEQLGKIISQVNKLGPEFSLVEDGMNNQAKSADSINDSMMQLSESAEQTKESISEFKIATEQLNEAIRILQDEVSRFKINS